MGFWKRLTRKTATEATEAAMDTVCEKLEKANHSWLPWLFGGASLLAGGALFIHNMSHGSCDETDHFPTIVINNYLGGGDE